MLKTSLNGVALTAVAATITLPVAVVNGDWRVCAVLAGAVVAGLLVVAAIRGSESKDDQTERQRLGGIAGMWFVFTFTCGVVTWLAVSVDVNSAGAPELTDPNSALFETASATSTTGLSMLADASLADAWLQWWRSILQWLGALGVIVFAVLVAEPSGDHDSLVGGEWGETGGDDHRETIKRVVVILTTLTSASIVALIIVGEPVWRAVNHGLTASATGGFTITEGSAAASGGGAQIVLVVTILISAISFGTLWDIGQRTGAPLWRRTQVRWGLSITLVGVCFALLVSTGSSLSAVAFDSISASTTAGFSAVSGPPSVGAVGAVAMMSMLIGGAAGSTGGGIKVSRVVWLAKAVMRWTPGTTEVSDEESYLWDGDQVPSDDARRRVLGAAAIATTWFVTLALGTIALATFDRIRPVSDALYEAISAMSGVGLSSGFTDSDLGAGSKSTLSLLMVLGRIEITAAIILVTQPLHQLRADHH